MATQAEGTTQAEGSAPEEAQAQAEVQKPETEQVAPRELTFGEKAVGLSFNPSGNSDVQKVKEMYAAVIDHLNNLREMSQVEIQKQYFTSAIIETQGAQMWAVKAITV